MPKKAGYAGVERIPSFFRHSFFFGLFIRWDRKAMHPHNVYSHFLESKDRAAADLMEKSFSRNKEGKN